jgi:hypothetical protein
MIMNRKKRKLVEGLMHEQRISGDVQMYEALQHVINEAINSSRESAFGDVLAMMAVNATPEEIADYCVAEYKNETGLVPVWKPPFQWRVKSWMAQCFSPEICADKQERCDRFLEEALELVQASGYTAQRANTLVQYVFNRPVGQLPQEVGGVMVTLAAFCMPHNIDMHECGEIELQRISDPKITQKIRDKQKAKRDLHGPLP